eukprot:2839847-Prymnesium_polylepis.1
MNFVNPNERLDAVGLRLALEPLIVRSCPPRQRPRIVEHDETQNNRRMRVPGLSERARFHNGLDGAIKASVLPDGFKLEDRALH